MTATAVGASPFVPWAGYLLTGLLVGGGGRLIAANTLAIYDSPPTPLPPVQEAKN